MIYRNKKILQAAKDAPICFSCGRSNDGTIVACHSNSQKDGKGMGIKASDQKIAYMCNDCHICVDRSMKLSRSEKREKWMEAHVASMAWLFESGMVDVK